MCTGIHLHVHLPAIYAYTYTNCHCNSHCNSYRDCHGDFHSDFHTNYNYDSTTNSDSYAYSDTNDYAQANPYAQAAWDAEGTTHPAAAPVIWGAQAASLRISAACSVQDVAGSAAGNYRLAACAPLQFRSARGRF